ncbi:hypothetical protein SP40_59 [Salmonella phage 40]|nr:hypothetical protein SP40_59 [Salmonella phage 40]
MSVGDGRDTGDSAAGAGILTFPTGSQAAKSVLILQDEA